MFLKLLDRTSLGLRRAPLTMQVLKYGKTNHMEQKAICGLLDAFCMKWLLKSLLLLLLM